jgi:predicted dienelactone hydrolase
VPATGPFPVAHITRTLLEPASATAGARSLPTVIRYPLTAGRGAPPPRGFPLVVFSQGFDLPAQAYVGLLHAWAAAGYVVAAPTYPETDPDVTGGPDEADIVNHPADLRFVLSSLIAAGQNPHDPLYHRIDPARVAVVGQSDGGNVSLAVAADSCCRDPSIRAAVILSGAELASFGGSYFTAGSPPLLVVQGTADSVNPPGCSALAYDTAPRSKYFLELIGARHLPPYLKPGPVRRGVIRVVTAFLNASLGPRRAWLRRLVAAGTLPGGLRLSSGAHAPIPQSGCPGAP